MDVPHAGSLTPHWGCESPHQWSTFKIPKVSLPDVLCEEVGGVGVATQRLRCAIHSTVLSCHCLPHPCPHRHPQPWSGHACPPCLGQRQPNKGADLDQNKHCSMAAFYIPGRSWSVTIDLWPNVVWTEPAEAASAPPWPPRHHSSPLLGNGQRGGTGMRVTGHPRILLTLPSPMTSPYCCSGSGAREAAALAGSAFPSVSVGVW